LKSVVVLGIHDYVGRFLPATFNPLDPPQAGINRISEVLDHRKFVDRPPLF